MLVVYLDQQARLACGHAFSRGRTREGNIKDVLAYKSSNEEYGGGCLRSWTISESRYFSPVQIVQSTGRRSVSEVQIAYVR